MKPSTWAVGVLVQAIVLTACTPVTHALKIGDTEFQVEIAETEQTQRAGLSGRAHVPEGTGMLFVFAGRQEQQVWIAGMQIPIDIAWLVDGRVLAVDTLDPCDLEPGTVPTMDVTSARRRAARGPCRRARRR